MFCDNEVLISRTIPCSDGPANRGNACGKAPLALFGCFVQTGLARIDFVFGTILNGRDIRHHDIGAARQAQLTAAFFIDSC